MTGCERLRRDAPGLAALREDDPARIAARAHASGCADCARALREAERLQALLLEEGTPVALPDGALDRARAAIATELRRETRRVVLASALSACGGFAALLAFARHRAHSAGDWTLALTLAAVAAALSAAARRMPRLAVGATVVAALTAAALTGSRGPLAPLLGVECLATELATAGLVVAAAWLALRVGTTVPATTAMAGAAGAGALVGDAALQITCAAHGSAPHLLVFHVGGILLALGGVAALWARRERAALA